MYQFGGGETRISIMKIGLPCIIGDNKVIFITEVVDAKIPLLIGTNSLEKAEAKLDFGSFLESEWKCSKLALGIFVSSCFRRTWDLILMIMRFKMTWYIKY